MATKTKTVTVKAQVDDNGYIKGYASTWVREPDSYGDIVAKGAFAECIEKIKANGESIPLLWNHNSNDLDAYIGTLDLLEEDDHGLLFGAPFDNTAKAQRARELAQDGRISKFSFAYDILDQGTVTLEDGRKANELRKLNLREVSLVLYPANSDTSLVEIKSEHPETTNRDTSVVEVKGATVTVKAGTDDAIAKSIEDATGFMVQSIEYKTSADALPEVTITAIAPNGLKAGRRNSKADEDALREVLEACADADEEIARIRNIVNGLIDAETPAEDPDEQKPETDANEAKAASEEPGTANGEEPTKANPEELGKANDSAPDVKVAEVEVLLQQASEILEKGI